MKFYVKPTVLAFYFSVISVGGLNSDYDGYWNVPKFRHRIHNTNSKKMDAKTMLDFKYKYKNASFGLKVRRYNFVEKEPVVDQYSMLISLMGPFPLSTHLTDGLAIAIGFSYGKENIYFDIRNQSSRYRRGRKNFKKILRNFRIHQNYSHRTIGVPNGRDNKYLTFQNDSKQRRGGRNYEQILEKFGMHQSYSLPENELRRVPQFLRWHLDLRNGTDQNETFQDVNESNEPDQFLHPYSIVRHMESLQSHFPTANITVEVIAKTISYNDIVLLKITQSKPEANSSCSSPSPISDKYIDESEEKKKIFIVHGLSVMGIRLLECLRIEKKFIKLLNHYVKHLDKFDILLMPMANPDGIEVQKMIWNKNATPQRSCVGVAVDRNFDVAWSYEHDLSSCSQHYPGAVPFSEIESRAVRTVFHNYSNKIQAYIHVHSGTFSPKVFKGDAVLYPRGYTDITIDDDKYIDLKGEIDEGISAANFRVLTVTVDTLYNWYGRVRGTSVDYASRVFGIPFCFEFVMQLYENDMTSDKSEELETNVALDQVWGTVINITLNYIYRTVNPLLDPNNGAY